MKHFYTLVLVAVLTIVSAHADSFVSDGSGKAYTFQDLSQISGAGVELAEDGSYTVTQDFTISALDTLRLLSGDVVKLGNGVSISVDGFGDFAPADTALVTRDAEDSNPKGFRFFGDDGGADMRNVRFEYVGITFGCANGHLHADNCTFTLHNGKSSSSGAIAFSASCDGNVIENCNFIENTLNAIGCGATNPVGIIIRNNLFYHNTTANRNKPQINMTCAGDYNMDIIGNTIIGGQFNLSGGIGVSNMMGLSFSGTLTIEDNEVCDNRYGIATIGSMNAIIRYNRLVDNHYESNPNNGGSCISIYDSAGKGNIYIEGNLLQGGLWGITIIGSPTINAGKTQDPTAADYNPGNNTFVDNGNNDVLYDFYNNGTSTIYAQGNTWNVAVQDSVSIEDVVFHKADNEALGLVIFMPAGTTTSVSEVIAPEAMDDQRYYNLMGQPVANPSRGIYIHNGQKIAIQ